MLERRGFLKSAAAENPELAQIERTLRRGNHLTAIQLVHLIENPGWLFELGNISFDAERQLEALGDAKRDAAPVEVVVAAHSAAVNKSEDVVVLMEWMKATIPPDGEVSHHYLAVRLLLGDYPNIRHFLVPKVVSAFFRVRNRLVFRTWFTMRPGAKNRRATFYHRPKLEFDL